MIGEFLKNIYFISFFVCFLSSITIFSPSCFSKEIPLTIEQIIETLQTPEIELDTKSIRQLEIAKKYWDNDPELAKVAIAMFIERNDIKKWRNGLPELEGLNKRELVHFSIISNPENAIKFYSEYVKSMTKSVLQLSIAMKNKKKGLIDSTIQKMSARTNRILKKSETRIMKSLDILNKILLNGSVDHLLLFSNFRNYITHIFNQYLESRINRYTTSLDWAREFNRTVWNFKRLRINSKYFKQSGIKTKNIFSKEMKIEKFRALVNQETITAGAMSTLLIMQGICIVASYGICSATLPATASWSIKGGQIAMGAAKLTIAGSAGASLIDRYRFGGVKGILSIGAAIDTLLILSILPRPTFLALAKNNNTINIFGKTIKLTANSKIIKLGARIASIEQKSTYMLSGLAGGYGAYQIKYANSIAKKLNKRGKYTTPKEVRINGAVNIALGLFGGLRAFNSYRPNLRKLPEYKRFVEAKRGIWSRYATSVSSLLPTKSIWNIYKGLASMKSLGIGAGMLTTVKGLGFLSYQFIVSGVYMLYGYVYPDFLMRKNSKPLPELKDGEFALILNGFAANDVLYHTFASEYANRFEIDKYGQNLKTDFFNSPVSLVEQIKKYSEQHGKIRYLKIMAHGIPGRMVPSAGDITAPDGEDVIDKTFLEQKGEWIRSITANAMAPDAQIVLISCLVGGNLKKEMVHKGVHYKKDVGDQFINAFGNTFLVNGGTVDSSRKRIGGFDGGQGPALDHLLHSSMKSLEGKQIVKEELQILKAQINEHNMLVEKIEKTETGESERGFFENKAESDPVEVAKVMGKRAFSMYSHIWTVVMKFGMNIEGGMFKNYHRQDTFEPMIVAD